EDGQDFDVPVIVVFDGLPVAQGLRFMQRVGRSVEHHMEAVRDGANAEERAAQKRGKVPQGAGARRQALEVGFVDTRCNPRFIRCARRVRTRYQVVSADLDDALVLLQLLRKDVAEYAALLQLIVLAGGTQLVKHAARNKGSGDDL